MVDRADMDENYTYIVRCADGTPVSYTHLIKDISGCRGYAGGAPLCVGKGRGLQPG